MGCHSLLQGIFPTQGLNPGLPHCRRALYPLSHQKRPGNQRRAQVTGLERTWARICQLQALTPRPAHTASGRGHRAGWAGPAPRPCAREQRERFRPSSPSPHARDPSPAFFQPPPPGRQWRWGLAPVEPVPVQGTSSRDSDPSAAAQTRTNRMRRREPAQARAGAGNGRNPRALGRTDWPRPQSCLSRIEPFPLGGRDRAPLSPIVCRGSASHRDTSGRVPRASPSEQRL